MDVRTLIRSLLIGFLPVVAFIAADHYFSNRFDEQKGMQYALLFAMAIGVAQLIFIRVREKRLDKMTLFDTLLVLVMGSISFLSGNDLFFKLKPALIELIMVILLFIIAFFSPRLLLLMTGRFTQGMEMTELHLKLMQRNAAGMFFIFLFHTLLTIYAAFKLSRDAWAFISGGLFYILAGIYFLSIFIMARIRRSRIRKSAIGEAVIWSPKSKIRKRSI
ncbi:MAG: hypothetical protein A2293_06195 [Elusimicrobia bacterium RIFOXYB2_FULL_49_7]|nr:MAG: hypothetical protein A2293_06195 [Elusimicrobia bacterium RIFOXYB2_FULL_49_7]